MPNVNPDGSAVLARHPNPRLRAKPEDQVAVHKIAEIVLGVAAPQFDFQSIPQDFLSLRLKMSLRSPVATLGDPCNLSLNGDVNDANYGHQRSQAVGAAAQGNSEVHGGAGSRTIVTAPGSTTPAGSFAEIEFEFPGYAKADRFHCYGGMHHWNQVFGANGQVIRHFSAYWKTLAAINRITVAKVAGDFLAGSSASLYGVMPGF